MVCLRTVQIVYFCNRLVEAELTAKSRKKIHKALSNCMTKVLNFYCDMMLLEMPWKAHSITSYFSTAVTCTSITWMSNTSKEITI